jgi:hypothetical protein
MYLVAALEQSLEHVAASHQHAFLQVQNIKVRQSSTDKGVSAVFIRTPGYAV